MEGKENNTNQLEAIIGSLQEAILTAQKTPICALYMAAKEFGGVRVGHESEDQPVADMINQIAKHPDVQALMNAETVLFNFQERLKS